MYICIYIYIYIYVCIYMYIYMYSSFGIHKAAYHNGSYLFIVILKKKKDKVLKLHVNSSLPFEIIANLF